MNTATKELVKILYDTEKRIRVKKNALEEKNEVYKNFEEDFNRRNVKVSFDNGLIYGKTKTEYLAEIDSMTKDLIQIEKVAQKLEKEIIKLNLPLNKVIELQLENENIKFKISSDVITENYRNISFLN